jgi:hypothetical protein
MDDKAVHDRTGQLTQDASRSTPRRRTASIHMLRLLKSDFNGLLKTLTISKWGNAIHPLNMGFRTGDSVHDPHLVTIRYTELVSMV